MRRICADYPGAYWRDLDERSAYPSEFVQAMTDAGYLAALIPETYGGAGLPLRAAGVVLEEIHASGCNASATHAQMYTMGTLLRHGSPAQKQHYLPQIAAGTLRLQAFGVTEPTTGSDTTRLKTRAVRDGDHYVVDGQKIWTSRALYSDLMLLLARTTPIEQVQKRTEGLSVFLVDIREAVGHGMTIRPIKAMINHNTTEVFFDQLRIPASALIGEEGKGLQVHPRRPECRAHPDRRTSAWATATGSSTRPPCVTPRTASVFDRPIGQEPGHPVPDRRVVHAQVEAAKLMMRYKAAALFAARSLHCGERGEHGPSTFAPKRLMGGGRMPASRRFGGFGFARGVRRRAKVPRDAPVALVAPISTNLILSYVAEHVLGLPRSY